ncbi:MAG TPA: CaiB/BaiF CoA-transferase family protein [Xanthobacteraceae bacterium]|nr:CaiB/BaiF CoA-transferase family protein [Xanthobacteraceae bacterium]
MPQPLSGVLVLDFTTLLPGPLATLILAEAGAEVIKIERPGGEDMRRRPPPMGDTSAAFVLLNRGKHGLVVDLKSAEGHETLTPLLRCADVVVEQFRPGVMDRLGLGYEAVRQLNPGIIYCSISGYGQSGPRAGEAGHDLNYISATGLLALNPGAPEHPTVPPALVADIGGGTFPAVMNILLALRQREQTGEGCHLDIAMADAMFTFAWQALAIGQATGRYPGPREAWTAGGSPRYALYPTRDGALVACAALEQKFWLDFCAAIGLAPALIDEGVDPPATRAGIAAIIAGRTASEWRPILAKADCCATIVASLEEAMRDPHFVERGLFTHEAASSEGRVIAALPLPIAPAFRDGTVRKASPALGEDPS